MHPCHLLARALNIRCPHLPSNVLALLLRDRRQALGFEEIDAGAFGAEVGFQANEDEGRGGAEVEDFGVPLEEKVLSARFYRFD